MPPTGGLVETLPVGACNFLLRETVKSRRILDENALARDFIRHPLGQQIKEQRAIACYRLMLTCRPDAGRLRAIQ